MRATLLRLRDGVSLREEPGETALLVSPFGRTPLPTAGAPLLDLLRVLSGEGATEGALAERVLAAHGAPALAPVLHHLHRLGAQGLLRYTVALEGAPLLTLVPAWGAAAPCPGAIDRTACFRLSRFAALRREGDLLVLESPLAPARVELGAARALPLVARLAFPAGAGALCEAVPGLDAEAATDALALLEAAGLAGRVDDTGTLAEERDGALAFWEAHDLAFHARTRASRSSGGIGATYRFPDRAPLPAVKPSVALEEIPLERPAPGAVEAPFTQVLEERRSVRRYGERPISKAQLAEFLHRAARVRSVRDADPAHGLTYQVTSRPYPSAGAAYDLELYLAVGACDGLGSGLYHYDPLGHALGRLRADEAALAAHLAEARAGADLASAPQVLVTLASRFPRVAWKYEGIAYRLTLQNVGVLLQTMYLVATAMGLAPCALGTADGALFARAARVDPLREPAVGGFLLGSLPRT